jgi:hypothetical protein
MVCVSADNGITGIGEACPLPFTADDDFNYIKRVIDQDLGPSLIGKGPFDFDLLNKYLEEFPHEIGTSELADDSVRGLLEDQGTIHPPIGLSLGVEVQNPVERH